MQVRVLPAAVTVLTILGCAGPADGPAQTDNVLDDVAAAQESETSGIILCKVKRDPINVSADSGGGWIESEHLRLRYPPDSYSPNARIRIPPIPGVHGILMLHEPRPDAADGEIWMRTDLLDCAGSGPPYYIVVNGDLGPPARDTTHNGQRWAMRSVPWSILRASDEADVRPMTGFVILSN